MRGITNANIGGAGDDIKFLEKEYNSSELYNEGDTVLVGGELYVCLSNGVTGTFAPSNWKRTYISDLTEIPTDAQILSEMIDKEYDPSTIYNVDDTVLYNGTLYICLSSEVTGKFDSSKWERVYLTDVRESNSDLGKLEKHTIVELMQSSTLTFTLTKEECTIVMIGYYDSYCNVTLGTLPDGCTLLASNGSTTYNCNVYIIKCTGNVGDTITVSAVRSASNSDFSNPEAYTNWYVTDLSFDECTAQDSISEEGYYFVLYRIDSRMYTRFMSEYPMLIEYFFEKVGNAALSYSYFGVCLLKASGSVNVGSYGSLSNTQYKYIFKAS